MMKTNPIGLYVHIPFCVKKCNYCDFCSFSEIDSVTRGAYIDRLCDEITCYAGKNIEIDTIFFGGGTPTLLTADEFARIVNTVKKSFVVSQKNEFTVEANPGTTTKEKIQGFVQNGVNRFSIGLQSIHKNELKILGRIHNFDDFKRTYHDMRSAGISNINVDLMYGIPEQTKDSFQKTLLEVAKLSPEHLSVYGLILEEGTPFFERKEILPLPDEEDECDMYSSAVIFLNNHGYSHYEISNYAKPGFESKHNLKYWRNREYIGVGVSAYSYFCGMRFGNTKNLPDYINNRATIAYSEKITKDTEKYEYVMLALRLREGFSLDEYKSLFLEDFMSGREDLILNLQKNGYLSLENGRVALTDRGFYVSNYILTELL